MISLKSADAFADIQEKKPVLYHIYCYYDSKIERFNQPYISNDEPGFVLESTKASILKGQFPPEKAVDLVLVYLGTFDLKTGEFDIFKEPYTLVELNNLLRKDDNADA